MEEFRRGVWEEAALRRRRDERDRKGEISKVKDRKRAEKGGEGYERAGKLIRIPEKLFNA